MSDFKALDFVYAGRRVGNGYKRLDCVYTIQPDGKLGLKWLFKAAQREKVIGGVYTGAAFGKDQAKGIETARYTGYGNKWHDREAILLWEAQHEDAKVVIRAHKLENDDKIVSQLEAMLQPARKLYTAARSRGDYATCMVLERALQSALRVPYKE